MPTGVYPRTETYRAQCREAAIRLNIGARLPRGEAINNPRWRGGRSAGYIKKLCDETSRSTNAKNAGKKRTSYHHKDGNRQNNSKENIFIVCRNCHCGQEIHNRISNIPKSKMGIRSKEVYMKNKTRLADGRFGRSV